MKLSDKTVNNTLEKARASFDSFRAQIVNGEKLTVSISKGNSKIGKVMNVSTMPVITCLNCGVCRNICYAMRSATQYTTAREAWCKNSALAMFARDEYFTQISAAMSRRRTNKFFRWHVAGDIPDYAYFCRMVDIAKAHPDFIIWTYTKDYWLINRYVREHGNDRKTAIPGNFSIMFSAWDGCKMNNPFGFPVFNFVATGTEDKAPKYRFCPGNCDICKANHMGCPYGENMNAKEH